MQCKVAQYQLYQSRAFNRKWVREQFGVKIIAV